MAGQKFKNYCTFIKMSSLKFLPVLNRNLKTELQIQDGGSNIADQKFESSSIFLCLIDCIKFLNSVFGFGFNVAKKPRL